MSGKSSDWVWQSRPTLTIWSYDSVRGAGAGEVRLQNLEHRDAVTVVDAITVVWAVGAHRPRMGPVRKQSSHAAARACILGGLVEMLTSQRGPGGESRLADLLAGTGIDRDFLVDAAGQFVPGTSALLVLSTDIDLDVVRPVIEHGRARADVVLLHTYLACDGVDVMRSALGSLSNEQPS